MSASIGDLRRMTAILEAEQNGSGVDLDEAVALASRLAKNYPGISPAMTRIIGRMGTAAIESFNRGVHQAVA
jgi:hypothetical protein